MTSWLLITDARRESSVGNDVEVRGWVRTRRDSKGGFSFLEINDGSCFGNLQIVVPAALDNYASEVQKLTAGCSVTVVGELKLSPASGQATELHAENLRVIGWCDAEQYPLQKKRHSFEKLREWAHLRGRTNTFGAVMRVRNQICDSIHQFFQENRFLYLQTPIITASDCEGAGEMFRVTTLNLEKLAGSNRPFDPSQEFFGKPAFLTVSGQLEGETYATALGRIYTFGPTFRAENSNTTRHLAEFWMIEPEASFFNLTDDMKLAVGIAVPRAHLRHRRHPADHRHVVTRSAPRRVEQRAEAFAGLFDLHEVVDPEAELFELLRGDTGQRIAGSDRQLGGHAKCGDP